MLDVVRVRLQLHISWLLGFLRAQIADIYLGLFPAIDFFLVLLHLLKALVVILDAIINVVLDRLFEDGVREHLQLLRISVDLRMLRAILIVFDISLATKLTLLWSLFLFGLDDAALRAIDRAKSPAIVSIRSERVIQTP